MMPAMGLRHWLQLAMTDGIGPILTTRLVAGAGSAQEACQANLSLLRTIEGIGRAGAEKLWKALNSARAEAEQELALAEQMGVSIFCPDDESYPLLLRSIPDPPAVLYVKGALEPRDLNGLAIVGSRRCSLYGREQAERFGALAAGAGLTVISGGARGVDSAAHRGAISHPAGRTIAVLGCGVDVVFPPENDKLFSQIAERGAVVSEYPLGTPPLATNFPRRNRIISGMSRGVLVVECELRSGALITARQAADDHNRPVFALPGRVDNAMSFGPHKLLRDGAILATGLEDILEGLGPLPQEAMETSLFDFQEQTGSAEDAPRSQPAPPTRAIELTREQRTILAAMDSQPLSVEQIIERAQLDAAIVLRELTMLSLRGQVKRTDGQAYARRGSPT
jgi:DNA processing protein